MPFTPTSEAERERQQQAFIALQRQLGQATADEIQAVLKEREPVEPEPGLDLHTLARFRKRL